MDDKQKRTLRALDDLDEKVVEKATKQRIALMMGLNKKNGRKKLFVTIGSMAAAVALILSTVLILVNVLAKQVPIYTGMSVSGLPDITETAALPERVDALNYAAPKGSAAGDTTSRAPASSNKFNKPLKDSLTVSGGEKSMYYAKPGEEILITVHVDNPDAFEILSFTLNGEKYTNYMFEQGSDLENLILKVNVGAAEGVVDYTIDAIKYIDGEKIKDVRMEGDKTVQVGVYTNRQPEVAVSDEEIGFNGISFNVSAADALNLVGLSEGKVQAVLYDGERIVATRDIAATGNTKVSFEGLSPNTLYEYALIATYDALDGEGKVTHILSQKAFYTAAHVLFDSVTLAKDGVSFSYKWAGASNEYTVTSAAVYQGEQKVADVAASATSITGLLPDTAYRLVVNYTCGSATGSISLDFTTDPLLYTAKYYLQNLDGSDYVLEKSVEHAMSPNETFAPEVLSFAGFTSPAPQTKTATVTDATPVVEYRYERKSFAVAFLNDGERRNETLKFGAALPDAQRDGYTFLGWFDVNGSRHTTVPAEAIVLTAQWGGELTAADLHYTGGSRITITGIKNLALTDISIPSYIGSGKVVAIAAEAFRDCDHLTGITLPGTLESVGEKAFLGCTALESVRFDGTLAQWCNIQFSCDENYAGSNEITGVNPMSHYSANPITQSGTLYLTSAPTVNLLAGEITLPTGELSGKFSFAGASITSLVIPADATWIPYGVVANCAALTEIHFNATNMQDQEWQMYHLLGAGFGGDGVSITVGAGVTRVPGMHLFSGVKIKAITFAAGSVCAEIGAHAFRTLHPADHTLNFCTELVIPASVRSIGGMAFGNAGSLTSLTLSEGLQSIGMNAFYRARALTTLTIPASVTYLDENAFNDLTGLTVLNFNATSATCGGSAFPGLGRDSAGVALIFGANVTKVPSELFAYTDYYEAEMAANVTSVTFAGNLCSEIGAGAFAGCTALETLVIPSSVTKIGEKAFYHCDALETITLPASLTEMGADVFRSCQTLTDIYFGGTQAAWELLDVRYDQTAPTVHYLSEG